MFSSSSRSARTLRANADGSMNVCCNTCGEFICKSMVRIASAQCELCRRVKSGEKLTAEMIKMYQSSKPGQQDVSILLLPTIEGQKKKFRLSTMTGTFLEAIGIKKKQKPEKPSVKAAREQ